MLTHGLSHLKLSTCGQVSPPLQQLIEWMQPDDLAEAEREQALVLVCCSLFALPTFIG